MRFEVEVTTGGSTSHHSVSMSHADYHALTNGKVNPEECVQAAFRFLLDREPKESILSSFDISVISRYFPEFKDRFSDYLSNDS